MIVTLRCHFRVSDDIRLKQDYGSDQESPEPTENESALTHNLACHNQFDRYAKWGSAGRGVRGHRAYQPDGFTRDIALGIPHRV